MGVPLSLIVTVPFEGFVVVKVPVVGISLSFAIMSIDANGVLTYDIIGQPADYNALINVVFVVK